LRDDFYCLPLGFYLEKIMKFTKNTIQRPLLITFCGLPGSGKTTLAKQLERETGAVRLNTDEWMAALGVDFFNEEMHEKLQAQLYGFGKTLLKRGHSIIVEDGHWSREERDKQREDAKKLGAIVELHYFDLSFDELWHRLEGRNAVGEYGTVPVTKEQLQEYWSMLQKPDDAELSLFDRYTVHT
jgi:predicted kinase